MTELEVSGCKVPKKGRTEGNVVTVKEIILGCFGFLAAIAVPYQGMAPFGVAFLAQERRFSLRSLLYFLIVCFGSCMVLDSPITTKYIAAGFLYLCVLFILERDVVLGRTVAAIVAGVCVLCTGLFIEYWNGLTAENLALLIGESCAVVVGAVLISRCSCLFRKESFNVENLSKEEKAGMGFVVVLAVLSLKSLSIGYVFSIMDMVAATLILVVAASGGVAFSTATGVILGAACGIDGNFFMPILGAFSFCGLMSGLFSGFGKTGVVVGLVVGSSLLIAYTDGAMRAMLSLYEVMAASVAFVLVPSKVILFIKRIFRNDGAEREYAAKIKEDLRIKLKSVSGSFGAMSGTLKRLSNIKEEVDDGDIATVFDLAADRVCKNCRKSSICWNKEFDFTYNALFKIMKTMDEKGEVQTMDADERFRNKCLNLPKLIAEINHQQDLCRVRCIWKSRLKESRELVSEQLSGMSEIIANLSEELADYMPENPITAGELYKRFDKKGIKVKKIDINREHGGRYRIGITLRSGYWKDEPRKMIMRIMKEVFDCDMKIRDMLFDDGKFVKVEFSEAERFKVETDYACRSASEENGDNYRFSHISEGKYVIALSDGMGTGSRAAKESEAMLELLDSFLRAGFDSRMAVRFINSIMLLKSEEEAFVTIDICIIDLYTGRAEFIKTGAEPSFVMYGNYIETIKAASLPAGIIANMEAAVTNRKMSNGAVIVMVTDGVETRKDGNLLWIGDFLKEKCKDNQCHNLAEKILNSAIEKNNGEINDDMTVLSVKLREVG